MHYRCSPSSYTTSNREHLSQNIYTANQRRLLKRWEILVFIPILLMSVFSLDGIYPNAPIITGTIMAWISHIIATSIRRSVNFLSFPITLALTLGLTGTTTSMRRHLLFVFFFLFSIAIFIYVKDMLTGFNDTVCLDVKIP